MDKSRQQFEEWRSKNKSSTINLFDVWKASRESSINNLEPVGYIDNAEFSELRSSRVCYLYKDSIDKINIPLYRLDK
ncbi:hypothetical protein [Providencia sp.]|uniref:hypothetical protein n=1 Tax=Providencia sp. TaxID=589 RepID=UPI003F956382